MILYSLRCADGHQFDAWFRNAAAYDSLAAVGEVTCPTCGGVKVTKAPMAPRISKNRSDDPRAEKPAPTENDADAPAQAQPTGEAPSGGLPSPADIRRALSALRAHVESTCDYVGDRFPEEARRIHYNEVEPRPIYGEASAEEAEALQDEGVTVRRIPWLPRGDS